ncbi:hypothetical protein [Aerobium aerolatum]|uniref:Uncharacterized protein n=1 Tax=Aquamicrobium aerolatum DSM 21857 TaxID=1121003 RepID=A0A1I3HR01_9HYPH|nr:hypothetical protein [Aquamicrobium aerolatum]SFI37960.1 hypothetical protein SAMN03080618_00308 [Aquamicrobium aerolatum DSM 21857]
MPNTDLSAEFAVSLSSALKDMHRALISAETGDDPALRENPYTVLFALIGDPRFEWMGVLSQLITRLDEAVAKPEEQEPDELAQIVRAVQNLVGEGDGSASAFRMRHVMALQKEPEVGIATGKVRKALANRPVDIG